MDEDDRRGGVHVPRRDVTLRRPVVGWRRCHPDGRPGKRKAHYFAWCTQPNRACTIGGDSQRSSKATERLRENPPLSLCFFPPSLLAYSIRLFLPRTPVQCAPFSRERYKLRSAISWRYSRRRSHFAGRDDACTCTRLIRDDGETQHSTTTVQAQHFRGFDPSAF